MDKHEELQKNVDLLNEKIIKTDEVLKVLNTKKRELYTLNKKYKRTLEKFCQQRDEIEGLKSQCQTLNDCLDEYKSKHTSYERENIQLKSENEILEKKYNEYVNNAENKYQTACEEMSTLNTKYHKLQKTVENKGNKTKNLKKLQESLNKSEKQLEISNSTIINLKLQNKNLEEKQKETLNQLSRVNLEIRNLKLLNNNQENTLTKLKLEEKIKYLEEKLESSKTDLKNELEKLTKKFKNDKEILEEELIEERLNKNLLKDEIEKLNNEFEEKTKIDYENIKLEHKNEVHELRTKFEDEKKLLQDELEKLRKQITEEINVQKQSENKNEKIDENEDNIQDTFNDLFFVPMLLSPLSRCSDNEKDEEEILNESSEHLTPVVFDNIKSLYSNSCSHLIKINNQNNTNLNVEHNKYESDLEEIMLPLINTDLKINSYTQTCEILTNLKDKILIDSYSQTCDNLKENIIKSSLKEKVTSSVAINTDFTFLDDIKSNVKEKISFSVGVNTDFSELNYFTNVVDFKKFTPVLNSYTKTEKLKNTTLKSKIIKKYKSNNNNNKNSGLNILRNSKLNVKTLLKNIDVNSKFVILSPSIMKSSFNKTSSNILNENMKCGGISFYNRSYQNPISSENYFCCPPPHYTSNCIPNRCEHYGFCPNYNTLHNCNTHNLYRIDNCCRRRWECNDNENNLRTVLKEYKKMLSKIYRKKYLSRCTNKYFQRNEFRRKLSKKQKYVENRKHRRYKRILYSSNTEEESSSEEVSDNLNFSSNKINNISKNNLCTNIELTSNVENDNEDMLATEELKQNICHEKTNEVQEVNSENINKIMSKNTTPRRLNNKIIKPLVSLITSNNYKFKRSLNTLSAKQKSILRKTRTIQNKIFPTQKNIKNLKRKSNFELEPEYKKQKLDLFGSYSDDSDDELNSVNRSNEKNTITPVIENNIQISNIPKDFRVCNSKQSTSTNTNKNQQSSISINQINETSTVIDVNTNLREPIKADNSVNNHLLSENLLADISTIEIEKDITKFNKESIKKFKVPNIIKINRINSQVTSVKEKTNQVVIKGICTLNENNKYSTKRNEFNEENEQKSINESETVKSNIKNVPEILQNTVGNILNDNSNFSTTSNSTDFEKLEMNLPVASTSDADIIEHFTYNILERVETIQQPENVTEMANLELGEAERLIETLLVGDWNDADSIQTAVDFLITQNIKDVARLIVNRAAKDFSQELDKTFTPPAPLLTVTQQKILVLLHHLKNNLEDIYSIFLETLERKLLQTRRVEEVHPLTRLYVAVCKLILDVQKVRILCCNAAYYKGELLLPLMFIVLTMWADVLPMACNVNNNPLITSLVQIIRLKKCKRPGFNCTNVHSLLNDYFGYKPGTYTNEEIFKNIVQLYSETYSKSTYTAILMLCKNLPNTWTHKQIKTCLLPLLDNCSNEENKTTTLCLIQRLISVFRKKKDKKIFQDIKNSVAKYNT